MSNVRVVLAAALAAVAGLSVAPAFGGLGPALVLAVLAPPAVAAGWGLWAQWAVSRRPQAYQGQAPHGHAHRSHARQVRVPLPYTAVGMLAVAAAVTATTRPGSAVASGPSRLLTAALPADPTGPELAAVSAVTGYAALIGCYLVLTRRAALAPVFPALLCLLAGLGLAAATSALPAWYPLAFIALTGLLLATARPSARPGVTTSGTRVLRARAARTLVTATVVLAVAVALPIPLANLAPGSDAHEPADLRSAIAAPVRPKTHTNPLTQYLALRDGQLPLTITSSATEPVDRLRMVTLTDFDGHTWSTRADYRRAGHQLPPAAAATGIREVTIDVSVSDPGVLGWLPTAGRPTHISIAGLGVDENTGDIVIPTGSDTPASYRVTGVEPLIDKNDVALDEPAPTATPFNIELTPDILGHITAATRGQPTNFARFSALFQSLASPQFGYDGSPEAAGGHGLYQISAMLRDKNGTSEQFASAFAVMCRYLGWDARVVLGFRTHSDGDTLTATSKDIHAWVEVRFNQLGWVPFDPTPEQASLGREPPSDGQPQPQNPNPGILAPTDIPQQPPPEPPDTPPPAPVAAPTGQPTSVVLTILGGSLLALTTLAIPAAKTIRRARRRRTGTARTRIIAAWRETLDALRQTGQQLPAPATTGDIIATTTNGIPELHTLARQTDYAAFSPDEATDADARSAWTDSDTIRKTVHHQLRLPARLRAALDPRPLLNR